MSRVHPSLVLGREVRNCAISHAPGSGVVSRRARNNRRFVYFIKYNLPNDAEWNRITSTSVPENSRVSSWREMSVREGWSRARRARQEAAQRRPCCRPAVRRARCLPPPKPSTRVTPTRCQRLRLTHSRQESSRSHDPGGVCAATERPEHAGGRPATLGRGTAAAGLGDLYKV